MPITFYRWDNIAANTLLSPRLLRSTPRHSHSIVHVKSSALIFLRKFFRPIEFFRLWDRQRAGLLIQRAIPHLGKFSLPGTIGIGRTISCI